MFIIHTKRICFLRLDTDLYTTTKIQLEILYPRLEKAFINLLNDSGFPGIKIENWSILQY